MRPSIYTKELAEKICGRLAVGENLRAICREEGMPHVDTIMQWNTENREGFSELYANARAAQAQYLFDELLEIADDGTNDFVEKEIDGGKFVINPNTEHIARSRLRVDTRKWYLSKVLPKVYGDKAEIDHKNNGKDFPTPILYAVPSDDGNA